MKRDLNMKIKELEYELKIERMKNGTEELVATPLKLIGKVLKLRDTTVLLERAVRKHA